MGGGGGGTLNKLFPGYKDKIWVRVPPQVRRWLIVRENDKYEKALQAWCITNSQRFQWFNRYVGEPLQPAYQYRNPAVDYKRQIQRGTQVEGRDYYVPDARSQQRLLDFEEPYSEEERKERSRYKHYDLKAGCVVLGLGFLLYDYTQSRPLVWCSEKFPEHPPNYPFWFKGLTHTCDVASLRRGFEVYRQVCSTCHSIELRCFRHLVNAIYPAKRMKQIAAEYEVTDGPDDHGEMFQRPCELTDTIPGPYPNEEAARYANNGAKPPDLSLIVAGKESGCDYIMSLLTGYRDPPTGVELREGLYYNPWFPGGAIAMAPPLENGQIEFEDGTPATVSQMAKDVVNFLTWSAEPIHDERVVLALKALTGCMMGIFFSSWWVRFVWAGYYSRRIDFGQPKFI